jgi:hypothetical protein
MLRLGVAATIIFGLLLAGSAVAADNCTVSPPFQIAHPQKLSGELRDLMGGPVGGTQLYLVSDKKILRYVNTDQEGKYDFGDVPEGMYYLRMKDRSLCAPEVSCDATGCRVDGRVKRNPK